MTVKIGHAVQDERGKASGGTLGDQTGKEILVTTWYNRTGGWDAYLECTDAGLAERAARYMERICEGNYGYSQSARWTGYKAIKAAGGNVEAAKGDFDCSSLVVSCYIFAGLNHAATGYTGSIRKSLLATGKFREYTDAKHLTSPDYAKRGGLYLKAGKHVLMCLSDGAKAGQAPEDDTAPNERVPCVLTLGSLNIRTGSGTQYKAVGQVKKGVLLPYLGTDVKDEKWYMVRYGGQTRYISSKPKYTRLVE